MGYLNGMEFTNEEKKDLTFSGSNSFLNTGKFNSVPSYADHIIASVFISCDNLKGKNCDDHFNVIMGDSPNSG